MWTCLHCLSPVIFLICSSVVAHVRTELQAGLPTDAQRSHKLSSLYNQAIRRQLNFEETAVNLFLINGCTGRTFVINLSRNASTLALQ